MNTVIPEIDANTLKSWLADESVVLIDIREQDEYARENIPESRLVSLSKFGNHDFDQDHLDKRVVFHCASGNRTAMAAIELLNTGFSEVYILKNGIAGWKAAGLITRINKKVPICIMRQVQIIVGASMLLGIVLGLLVSPWFFGLSAMMGGGILFAGISGACTMANVLTRLPYNRLEA